MRYLLGRSCKDTYLLETPLYKGILNYSGTYRRFFEKIAVPYQRMELRKFPMGSIFEKYSWSISQNSMSIFQKSFNIDS